MKIKQTNHALQAENRVLWEMLGKCEKIYTDLTNSDYVTEGGKDDEVIGYTATNEIMERFDRIFGSRDDG